LGSDNPFRIPIEDGNIGARQTREQRNPVATGVIFPRSWSAPLRPDRLRFRN
jgi:hypothetical protein